MTGGPIQRLALGWAAIGVFACGATSPPAPATRTARSSPFEAFATTSPRPGEPAPGFELRDLDGNVVKLVEATARGPVVLVWGSFT